MILDKDDNDIEEVLFRYFREELSESEVAEVEEWRARNFQNQEKYDEVHLLFLDLRGLAYYNNVATTTDQSWDRFRKEYKIAKVRPLVPTTTILRYAASVVIVLSAAFGAYRFLASPDEVLVADVTAIEEVKLGDGSEITLNQGASLAYMEPFQNNERRVSLEGSGYFTIAENPEKPFVIETSEVEVRVLGTKFYINELEDQIDLKVEEGKVLLSYRDQHEIVEAGESFVVRLSEATIMEAQPDSIGLETFWRTRKLVFNLTAIEEVVAAVNHAYGTNLRVEGSTEDCALTVIFEDESFENVVEVIKSTLNYQVITENDAIILRGNGCN